MARKLLPSELCNLCGSVAWTTTLERRTPEGELLSSIRLCSGCYEEDVELEHLFEGHPWPPDPVTH